MSSDFQFFHVLKRYFDRFSSFLLFYYIIHSTTPMGAARFSAYTSCNSYYMPQCPTIYVLSCRRQINELSLQKPIHTENCKLEISPECTARKLVKTNRLKTRIEDCSKKKGFSILARKYFTSILSSRETRTRRPFF